MGTKISKTLKAMKGDKVLKIISDGTYTVLEKNNELNECERSTFDNFILIFDNGYALFIKANGCDSIKIGYRMLSSEEKDKYLSEEFVDLFNDVYIHHDYLGEMIGIDVEDRKKDYKVCVETRYDIVEDGEYLENRINIKLTNGVMFNIYPSNIYDKQVCIKVIGCKLYKGNV